MKKFLIFKLGFTPCKAEQSLQDMTFQEKEEEKDEKRVHENCSERAKEKIVSISLRDLDRR